MIEINNIEVAIHAYHTIYGKWPNQTQSLTDTCYAANNAPVIRALINNPRSEVCLHCQISSISTNPDNMGSYLDPWHHPFIIVMDDSGNNKVSFNTGNVVLTNSNGTVTTNTMNFIADFDLGIASWGNRDTPLSINQANYLNMDLSSWQMGEKTK